MNDSTYGIRDEKGNWKPFALITYPPLFTWPFKPGQFLSWVFGYPGYLLPWNLFYAAAAALLWLFLTPSIESLKTLGPGWIAFLLARNLVLVLLFYGVLHFGLYIRRVQGQQFKYNRQWLQKSAAPFLFKDQTYDNMFWTLCSGVPTWTACEAFSLWAFSNGYFLSVQWESQPVYLIVLLLLIPIYREFHFYLIHRLLHNRILYRLFHFIHHKNTNPGPWSGLSMHPFEHLLYFSGVLIHFIVPAHPVHAIFQLVHAALSPAVAGHSGFDKLVIGDKAGYAGQGVVVETNGYAHYLHHKYFECNYADGVIPLDKWLGTFHDGSQEAREAMIARMRQRRVVNRQQKTGRDAQGHNQVTE